MRVSVEEKFRSGVEELVFETEGGRFDGRYHPIPDAEAAVIWVGGVGGGLHGPAGGMYPRLSERLRQNGIASLRLDYRKPGELLDCVLDTLAGADFLAGLGHKRLALVGHSFGGAVVITAAASNPAISAVATLATQSYGASGVSELAPRPVIFLHGMEDPILPETCSIQLYRKAGEPKDIKIYAGCRHTFDECPDQVDRDLLNWLLRVLPSRG